MSLLEALRRCVHRDREVIAVFEHGAIGLGWMSPDSIAPPDRALLVCGAMSNGHDGDWTPLRLQVGEFYHGFVCPELLALIPPRQSYAIGLPHGPSGLEAVPPATVELLGWELPWR